MGAVKKTNHHFHKSFLRNYPAPPKGMAAQDFDFKSLKTERGERFPSNVAGKQFEQFWFGVRKRGGRLGGATVGFQRHFWMRHSSIPVIVTYG